MSAGAPPPDDPPPPEDAPTVYQPYVEPPPDDVVALPPEPPPLPPDLPPGPPPPLGPGEIPPEPEASRELWPWLLLLLVLVIGGLLAAYLLTRHHNDHNGAGTTGTGTVPTGVSTGNTTVRTANTVAVPSVVGGTQTTAQAKLKAAGLTSQVRKQSSAKPAGTVLAQAPAAGAKVKPGALVGLTVSGGPPTKGVPGVVGLSVADASSKLTSAGFQTTVTRISSTRSAGTVLSQAPIGGSDLKKGGIVKLTVSKGPPRVTIPDVTGLKRAAAAKKLHDLGLVPKSHGVASKLPPGTVVREQPRAGQSVPQGTTVRLSISNGPSGSTTPAPTVTTPTTTTGTTTTSDTTQVPDVTGEDEQQATSDLESAGFQVKSTDRTVTDQTQDGVVLDEKPVGGTDAPSGSTVTIVVGRFSG